MCWRTKWSTMCSEYWDWTYSHVFDAWRLEMSFQTCLLYISGWFWWTSFLSMAQRFISTSWYLQLWSLWCRCSKTFSFYSSFSLHGLDQGNNKSGSSVSGWSIIDITPWNLWKFDMAHIIRVLNCICVSDIFYAPSMFWKMAPMSARDFLVT